MSRVHVTVEAVGDRLVWRAPYECREVSNALPGAQYDKSNRAYHAPRTLWTLDAILRAPWKSKHPLADVLYTDDVKAMQGRLEAAKAARRYRVAEDLPDVPSKTFGRPGPFGDGAGLHQRQAFWFGGEQEALNLLMTMGSGKSKVVVDLVNAWDCKRVFIVCPNNVVGVWPREFRKHSLNDYHVTDCTPFKRNGERKKNATVAQRAEQLELELERFERLVVVLTHAAFWREPMMSLLQAHDWDCGSVDEEHRTSSAGSKSGRALDRLRARCARRIGGTGSKSRIVGGLDAYGVCRFLDPGLFGTSFAKHKARFGKPKVLYYEHDVDADGDLIDVPVYLTVGPKNERVYEGVKDELRDEYADRLGRITYECGDEVLDLPEPVHADIPVELSGEARSIYDELESTLVAEVADADSDDAAYIIVNNVLSKYLRLQQLTSGIAVTERECDKCADGDDICVERHDVEAVKCSACEGTGVATDERRVDTAKQDALADRLADIDFEAGERYVVFAKFRPDLDAIREVAERAGLTYAELSGRRRDALDADAELAEHAQVAGVQIQAGGVGIDFTRARHGGYYSVGYSYDDFEQSERRLHRPGMDETHPCHFDHYVARGTIDEHVYRTLRNKGDVTLALVEYLRAKAAVYA